MTPTFPTPYQEINLVLDVLLSRARTTLGNRLTAMYLYGSLAAGDFDPGRSDIDFLVVTSSALPDELISELRRMHRDLFESDLEWGKKLEGAYIPIGAVRKYSEAGPACPLVNKDEFLVARPEQNWVINRHVLYTSGVTVAGRPPRDLIDPVRPEELREAVRTLLRNNWKPWVHRADLFAQLQYAQPFVVLTMCRALYTLEKGAVVSKRRSGEWVISTSDGPWSKLVTEAMAWRQGDTPGDIRQTQKFIQYVLRRVGIQTESRRP